MDFLNKAKETIASASKDFSQKASETGELAKGIAKIRELDKNYIESLKQLGEKMLEDPKAAEICPELVEAIKTNRNDYAEAKKNVAALKGKKICPECGAEQNADAAFCSVCGVNIADIVVEKPAKAKGTVCASCGKEIDEDARFCSACGAAVKKDEE